MCCFTDSLAADTDTGVSNSRNSVCVCVFFLFCEACGEDIMVEPNRFEFHVGGDRRTQGNLCSFATLLATLHVDSITNVVAVLTRVVATL